MCLKKNAKDTCNIQPKGSGDDSSLPFVQQDCVSVHFYSQRYSLGFTIIQFPRQNAHQMPIAYPFNLYPSLSERLPNEINARQRFIYPQFVQNCLRNEDLPKLLLKQCKSLYQSKV